jgi:ribonuclease P protein component
MLPRTHRLRLRTQKDFFGQAARVQTPSVRWFINTTDSKYATAAIVVPKTVERLATRRNQLKRKFTAALLPLLQNAQGIMVVGIIKKTNSRASIDPYEDIRQLDHRLHS